MWPWSAWRRRRVLSRRPIPEPLWGEVLAGFPVLGGLDPAESARLRELVQLFLHEKRFVPIDGVLLDEPRMLVIAAQACLPILGLDIDWYRSWTSILVYPEEFVAPREELDEDGLHHEWEEVLSGESRHRGPVLLSWADVEESIQLDGYNVIIHEVVHMIDMLNGEPNGFPPLHRDMPAGAWTRAFSEAYDDLCARVDAGEETLIDPYAAQDPGEFFAVISEYFFECPNALAAAYPGVYRQLKAFFRQDPGRRLPT